jgi:tetratricopeptide (TPR) repeat protein
MPGCAWRLTFIFALVSAAPAGAQVARRLAGAGSPADARVETPAIPDPVARSLNADAQTEYDLGHYRKALETYEGLFKVRPLPSLLFNIAQCHRKLGELREAANTYRSYLVYAEPGSAEMLKAKELLAQVEDALKQSETAAKSPPNETLRPQAEHPTTRTLVAALPRTEVFTQPPAPPAPSPPRSRTRSYVVAGGGLAALAAGVVFGLRSRGAASDLSNSNHSSTEVTSLRSTGRTSAIVADVFFLAALGCGATAVILW